MTLFKNYVACLCVGLLYLMSGHSAHALTKSTGVLTGKVIGISDGDTITVLNEKHEQFKGFVCHVEELPGLA